jgi:CheY-like chemotaxis protein
MKKTKVLYVEDETFLAKIVSETLESRGYEVVLEEDGGKAMQKFTETKPMFVCWILCFPIKTVSPLPMK